MNKNEEMEIIEALIKISRIEFSFARRNGNEFVLFNADDVAIYFGALDGVIGFINGANYLIGRIIK